MKMHSEYLDEVFLELYPNSKINLAPIETLVTLFIIKYCDSDINIKFVKYNRPFKERAYSLDISSFQYEIIEKDSLPHYANSCELPQIILNESSCIAGLCASLRQIIRRSLTKEATLHCQSLLGFKGSCLLACSEVSVWTKFCEVDLISTLKLFNFENLNDVELPVTLARFECHMSHPVRLHNLYKCSMSKKVSNKSVVHERKVPEHFYAEGSTISLADIIIFVCIYVLLNSLWNNEIRKLLPLTSKWYNRMIVNERILRCLTFLSLKGDKNDIVRNYTLPLVENQSLYKSDPKRYKPKSRIFTRQEDIDNSLKLIKNLNLEKMSVTEDMFAGKNNFDWSTIPIDATPEGGSLPISRLKKKFEQLENLCKPIISIAKNGDVIVDFCSGSGHLGILIAYLLPQCSIILLENKEESLNKAKERVKRLKLDNIQFYQCNLDYFKGDFNIGTSLHACGVATDLVMQHCIRRNAAFVCCPCCYGSVHDCHHIVYPRSDFFKKLMDNRSYMVLSHAADQTHSADNVKTKQGYECMKIVDVDRRLQAEQFGYTVHLGKLIPETCTPKNHLLVGIPSSKTSNLTF